MIPNFYWPLMRVKFLIFVSLLFVSFSSSVNANFSGVDVRSKSDASVCSWFSVVSVAQVWIDEAKRRKITCGGDKRLIPRNSYASGKGWRCKSNYVQKGWSCVKKTPTVKVPSNAHKSGNSWICNTDYYKAGSMCRRVPLNAYSKYNSNFWYCNDGYVKKGGKCQVKITVPKNAHIDNDSWTCNTDYYKVGSMCRRVPANAYSRYYSNEFRCNAGFEKKGSGCVKIVKKIKIPVNAHVDGNGWICNTDYYRNTAKNNCLKVPKNAYSKYNSNYWYCKSGFKKKGNGCENINKAKKIPVNAHIYGNGWVCNTNYYRNKANNNCLKVPQNAYSKYNSNDWYCKNGFKKKGSGCVDILKIPVNAHTDGTGWTCNTDYYRNNAKNNCLRVPQNGYSKYDSNYWYCNNGYEKSGNSCIKKVAASTSEIKGTDLSIKSDASICSWFEMANPPEIYFKEAKKRKLTCNLNSKLIPRNAYATAKTWKCHSGYKESGWSCVKNETTKLKNPANSHVSGTSWICDSNYYKVGSYCQKVPPNAYSSYNSNVFYCKNGYEKKNNNSCVKIKTSTVIPKNAHASGNGWICNTNYYRNKAGTGCLYVPQNATSSYNSNDFICNAGYKKKNGNSCVKVQATQRIPNNAHISLNGWTCDSNYYKVGSYCQRVPPNAYSSYNSNIFYCKDGYQKVGNRCVSDIDMLIDWAEKNWVLVLIILAILISIFRKKKNKSKPRPSQKPEAAPRSQPKPKPRPAARRQSKPKRRRIKEPRVLLIELGVAVALADGELANEEGIALNNLIKRLLREGTNTEKLKKLYNNTLLEAHTDANNGLLDLSSICHQLNSKGTYAIQLEALKVAYEVMGADGHIHDKEAQMIKKIATSLNIESKQKEEIRDQFFIKTIINRNFDILNLLGLSEKASQHDKCVALKNEFRKWNGRLNILKSKNEKANAQKILDQIGIARTNNNC